MWQYLLNLIGFLRRKSSQNILDVGASLTTIGSLAGIILFSSFLIWGILDLISCRARRSTLPPAKEKASVVMTLATVAVGIVAFLPFAHIAFGVVRY